jgi:hypothetical protein
MRSGKKREGEKEETYYDVVPLISQQPQQQPHCFSCGEVIPLSYVFIVSIFIGV